MESQLNSSFILDFSSFINDMCDGDYAPNFKTDQSFPTCNELIKLVQWVSYDLGFVFAIVRSDKYDGQPRRKTYVLLICERGGKYRKYKSDVELSIYGTRKCDCPFKLRGKLISNDEGWVLRGNM